MNLPSKLANKIAFISFRHLILKKFLKKVVVGVRQDSDPTKEGWKYHCFEEILLEHGRFFEALIDPPKQESDLVYTEGYAIPALSELPVPAMHSWETTQRGKAVEKLWEKPGTCYFGIQFERRWVERLIEARAAEGQSSTRVLDYDCWDALAFLKNGIPPESRFRYLGGK